MEASLTIQNLDQTTLNRLQAEARRRGVALSVVAREALVRGLPAPSPNDAHAIHHDLDSLAGTWSEDDAHAFLSAVGDFEQIDGELWK